MLGVDPPSRRRRRRAVPDPLQSRGEFGVLDLRDARLTDAQLGRNALVAVWVVEQVLGDFGSMAAGRPLTRANVLQQL